MEAQEEDKSPDIKQKKIQKLKKGQIQAGVNENLDLKPDYLDKQKVKSRLFGMLESDKSQKVDWKNLEKLTKDAIKQADMTTPKLLSLSKVLENEIMRLEKLDLKLKKELKKVNLFINILFTNHEF